MNTNGLIFLDSTENDILHEAHMKSVKIVSQPIREPLSDDVNSILMNLSKEGYAPQLVYDDNGRWLLL